jgi:hypothetical protein
MTLPGSPGLRRTRKGRTGAGSFFDSLDLRFHKQVLRPLAHLGHPHASHLIGGESAFKHGFDGGTAPSRHERLPKRSEQGRRAGTERQTRRNPTLVTPRHGWTTP